MLLWILDPAGCDATILNQALNGEITDLRAVTEVICSRTPSQLQIMKQTYRAKFGCYLEHDITERTFSDHQKAVKSETSGNFEFGLLTILRCAQSPVRYFAKVLHKAMKGLGTSDTVLIRVVVTRTEIDMQYIKAEYHKKYKRSLADAVHAETSRNYQTFLLSLVGRDRY
ncbi:hypothetical protein ACQ4PT_016958 [Festuca glaucescens]